MESIKVTVSLLSQVNSLASCIISPTKSFPFPIKSAPSTSDHNQIHRRARVISHGHLGVSGFHLRLVISSVLNMSEYTDKSL